MEARALRHIATAGTLILITNFPAQAQEASAPAPGSADIVASGGYDIDDYWRMVPSVFFFAKGFRGKRLTIRGLSAVAGNGTEAIEYLDNFWRHGPCADDINAQRSKNTALCQFFEHVILEGRLLSHMHFGEFSLADLVNVG